MLLEQSVGAINIEASVVNSQLDDLQKLIDDLKRSKNNQRIADLDRIAREFGCNNEVTSSNENKIYKPPYRDMGLAVVAIPHPGKKVKEPYVRKFIHMLEEILDRKQEGGAGTNE